MDKANALTPIASIASFVPSASSRIRAIVQDGIADCVCIAVAHPSKLYVTRHGIVTHNTTVTHKEPAFSFTGQQAVTANKMALDTAQDRLDAGEDPETVRKDTGWHKGVDGKWRFEISDADASLKVRGVQDWGIPLRTAQALRDEALRAKFDAEYARNVFLRERGESPSRISAESKKDAQFKQLQQALKRAEAKADKAYAAVTAEEIKNDFLPLGAVLNHPALFAAYPALLDMRIEVDANLRPGNANYSPRSNTIAISSQDDAANWTTVLLHEIQHGIQTIEGFATGSSPQSIAAVVDDLAQQRSRISAFAASGNEQAQERLEQLNAQIARYGGLANEMEGYRRIAGEAEARNTEARWKMTDAQRRATPPSATQDVADADVIVTFNGKDMASAPAPANAAPTTANNTQPTQTGATVSTIAAAIRKAYGNVLDKLQAKGLVTLVQSQDEAIEAAAKARAKATGIPLEQVREQLLESVRNSIARGLPGGIAIPTEMVERDVTMFAGLRTEPGQRIARAFIAAFESGAKSMRDENDPMTDIFGSFGMEVDRPFTYEERVANAIATTQFRDAVDASMKAYADDATITPRKALFVADLMQMHSLFPDGGKGLIYRLMPDAFKNNDVAMEDFGSVSQSESFRPLDEYLADPLLEAGRYESLANDINMRRWQDGFDSLNEGASIKSKGVTGQEVAERFLKDPLALVRQLVSITKFVRESNEASWGNFIENYSPGLWQEALAKEVDRQVISSQRMAIDAIRKASWREDYEGGDGEVVDLKRSADGAIQGFYDPQSGQSFLVADGMTNDAAPGVLAHEVGIHMATDTQDARGKAAMVKLVNRAGMILKLDKSDFMKGVRQRMRDAGETSNEEAAAYIAEAYERDRVNAPASVKRWVQDFMAAVRAWLFQHGVIVRDDMLTPADIAAIARANVRAAAKGSVSNGGLDGQLRRSDASPTENEVRALVQQYASTEGAPTEAQIREAVRQFRETERAYGGRDGYQKTKAAGKTKLTYGQWVQVRTPNFKNWFGDWQALRSQERLDAMVPLKVQVPEEWQALPVDDLRLRVEDSLLQLMESGEPLHHPEIGDVSVVRKGIKKALASSADPAKLRVLGDLRNAFEGSFLAGTQAAHGEAANVLAYDKLLARLDVGGTEIVAVFTVKRLTDGSQFYNTVALEDGQNKTPVASPRDTPIAGEHATSANTGVLKTGARDSYGRPDQQAGSSVAPIAGLDEFSRKSLARVNPEAVSKVVDPETGEPLVVYHGTAADVVAFSADKSASVTKARSAQGAFWFSDSAALADEYAGLAKKKLGKSGARNIMPAFLSVKDPKVVNLNGANYHELSFDFGAMVQTARKGMKSGTDWVVRPSDGMILRDFSDTPSGHRLVADHFVAFEPTQIKSATGNIGTFDPQNADIRHFEGPAQRRPGTAQDKAVMQAIADGKSARDVLRLVASGSKDPFLRQVARLLLKSGITPNIQFGYIGKTEKGDPIHGQYRGKSDTIAIAGSAEYAAERIFMHEAMHAATMRALDKPGLPKLQLQKLLEHVRKQPGVAGFYGTKSVDEFVAEVFTNPDFQAALRKMKAPSESSGIKTAWDGFVRILRSILGLKNDPNNALSQALELGVAAMREDMGLRRQGARASGRANAGTDAIDQTQTAAFKRWFGDWEATKLDGASVVREPAVSSRSTPQDMPPKVVYHGTRKDFASFAPVRDGNVVTMFGDEDTVVRRGIFFAENPEFAATFAAQSGEGSPQVMPVYLNIRNPMFLEDGFTSEYIDELAAAGFDDAERLRHRKPEMVWAEFDGEVGEQFVAAAKAAGYDGVYMREQGHGLDGEEDQFVWVAFDPEQVKSATGNNGNFDPADPNIMNFGVDDFARNVGEGIKSITATNIKKVGSHKLTDWLKLGLQFLGRRQLTDVYGDLIPQMRDYDRLAAQMEADKNESGAEADELVRRWAKLPDEGKLADLMHEATLAQVDADSDVEYVAGDDKAQSAILKNRFKALSPEAQAVYREARDGYKAHHEKVRKAIRERIERSELSSPKRHELLAKMDDDFFQKVKGVYFPLARFGRYVTAVKDGTGQVVSVSRAETMPEAESARGALLKAFPAENGFSVGRVTLDKEFVASHKMVGRGFMTDLYRSLEGADLPTDQLAELEDTLGQLYLSSLPDLSWAKHGIHRKGTPGFSQDARRAFAQNMFHGARYLAKLRYSDVMQDSLDAMQEHVDEWGAVTEEFDQPKAQRVVDEMLKRHDAMMNPKSNPLSTALTSFGFLYYLGLSPAAAMVNLSQTALVAYPVMAGKWGYKKSADALLRASKESVAGKNNIRTQLTDKDEIAAYEQAVKAGVIDVTMAHDLAGIAQGEDQKVSWALRPVMRRASYMFHQAELFNRQSTFMAAFRLAREAGATPKDAYEQAVKATYDGHFDYGAANRPRVMQGNVARVVLLFKQFAQNMIFTIGRSAYQSVAGESPEVKREARKVFSGLMTTHAMAAGVLGLPLVGPLLALASALGGDDDEPWDAEVALRNMLAEVFGPKASEVIARGFSRLTPWDISDRVGLDKLIFPDVQEGLAGKRWAEQFATGLLGPVVGMGLNTASAAQKLSNGDYGRALEDFLPVVLRNGVKSYRYFNDGAKDSSGIAVKDEVGLAGVMGQLVGFSPSEVRLAFEGKSAIMDADRRLMERRKELTARFAKASMAQDAEGVAEARKAVAEFNKKNPSRVITVPQLMQSVRARQRRIDQAQDGVYLPRNRRDAMTAGAFAGED